MWNKRIRTILRAIGITDDITAVPKVLMWAGGLVTTALLNIFAAVRALPWYYQALMGIGVLLFWVAVIVAVVQWHGRRPQKRLLVDNSRETDQSAQKHEVLISNSYSTGNVAAGGAGGPGGGGGGGGGGLNIMQATSLTPTDQLRADWMSAAINDDVGKLADCIVVGEPHISWEHLGERGDAYIEFHFKFRSSSVHLLEIGRPVEGHVRFQGGEQERIPEIIQDARRLKNLKRGRDYEISLKQFVSFTDRIRMQSNFLGKEVEFDFRGVNIRVEGTLPDGSPSIEFRFPLPDSFRIQIPRVPIALSPDTTDLNS